MTPSIQMRIDVQGMPHSFLSVTHPDGTITEYGLVPAVDGSPFNAGKIDITGPNTPHREHEKSFVGEPVQLTTEQYDKLMNIINDAVVNPPEYVVTDSAGGTSGNAEGTSGHNCTGWAVQVWNEAGIPNQFAVTNTWVWMPYGQAVAQFTKNTWGNVKGDVVGAIISIGNFDEWGVHFTELFPIIKKLNDLGHQIGQNAPLYDEVIENVKQQVTSAKSTSSPIILDLNNNGVETTAVKQGAYFDHANDGFAEQTGWVGANDGLLVVRRSIQNNFISSNK
jgi:hypothetical protein